MTYNGKIYCLTSFLSRLQHQHHSNYTQSSPPGTSSCSFAGDFRVCLISSNVTSSVMPAWIQCIRRSPASTRKNRLHYRTNIDVAVLNIRIRCIRGLNWTQLEGLVTKLEVKMCKANWSEAVSPPSTPPTPSGGDIRMPEIRHQCQNPQACP